MNKILNKLDKLLIFFLVYTLCAIIFYKTLGYILPFVIAILFSLILIYPANFLINKFKIKRSLSALLVTSMFFIIITFILYIGLTSLIKETIQLGRSIQLYINTNKYNLYNFLENINLYYNALDTTIINAIRNYLSNSILKISNCTMTLTSKTIQVLIYVLAYIPYLLMLILFTLISTYFFIKDFPSIKQKLLNTLSDEKSDKFFIILNQAKKMITKYLNSYLILIGITFLETLIVFFILRIKYAIILSILAAIFDILPILGIGGIYVPVALIYIFICKNYFIGFTLIISYIVVTIIRQIIEPKLISSSLGIHPMSVLIAIFIGLKANGILGMFFCMFLVIVYKILRTVKII